MRMSLKTAVAQLRHAYAQLVNGYVTDHRQFADGLIAPVIRAIEGDIHDSWATPDNWLTEPPKGEMFIWARPDDRGGWGLGLGYWTVSGTWRDAYGNKADATRFHALPPPPR